MLTMKAVMMMMTAVMMMGTDETSGRMYLIMDTDTDDHEDQGSLSMVSVTPQS